jgi:hypothetical protein
MRLIFVQWILPCATALLPLSTAGSALTDANGARVTYAGVNWPGHLDAMIPEGLQYRSVEQIVRSVKDLGMNVVRLTYATEMVDELLAGRSDVKTGLVRALGQANGSEIWKRIADRNRWSDKMTRLQVVFKLSSNLCRSLDCVVIRYLIRLLPNAQNKASWFI